MLNANREKLNSSVSDYGESFLAIMHVLEIWPTFYRGHHKTVSNYR